MRYSRNINKPGPNRDAKVDHPKVLIVGASGPDSNDATAITLNSLFGGWPKNRLFRICEARTGVEADTITSESGVGYIRTSRKYLARGNKTLALGILIGIGNNRSTLARKMAIKLRASARAVRDTLYQPDILNLRQVLCTFRPDLIYALGGSSIWTRVAIKISKMLRRPIIFHFMDDWPSTIHDDAIARGFWRRRVDRLVKKAIRSSPVHFAISEDMADEYSKRFGVKFYSFMRCVERKPSPIPEYEHAEGSLSLVYCGGLHLGRWKILAKIGEAIMEGHESRVSLTIFAPKAHLDEVGGALKLPAIVIGGSLLPGEEETELRRYDVAVHVESFDRRAVAYTRLSISTKIPLYFSIPMPVLCVGPPEISSNKWVSLHNAGVVVNHIGNEELLQAISSLADIKERKFFSAAAYRAFLLFHEGSRCRKRFERTLIELVAEAGQL